jgi:hypothetical protein
MGFFNRQPKAQAPEQAAPAGQGVALEQQLDTLELTLSQLPESQERKVAIIHLWKVRHWAAKAPRR